MINISWVLWLITGWCTDESIGHKVEGNCVGEYFKQSYQIPPTISKFSYLCK